MKSYVKNTHILLPISKPISILEIDLENTKKTAAEIETKVAEAKKTSYEIDKARELYRPAAARASVLYFILNDMNKINPMYQFSLKAFRFSNQCSVFTVFNVPISVLCSTWLSNVRYKTTKSLCE